MSTGTAFTDAAALSSSSVTITMGSMGSIMTGYSTGGNAGKYDGLGGAYEEVDDGGTTGLSNNQIGSTVDNAGIFYTSPSISAGGAYTPRATDTNLAGGGASGAATLGSAQNAGVTISHESGLKLGVFGNTIDRLSATGEDTFEGTWYATYALGPISVGYQQSYVNRGVAGAAESITSDKTVAAATGQFEGDQYSVTMNLNDNLSISYADADDTYDPRSGAQSLGVAALADVTMSMKSIQAAYSMGSMSIKMYRQTTDNPAYDSTGSSNESTEIALGLSF